MSADEEAYYLKNNLSVGLRLESVLYKSSLLGGKNISFDSFTLNSQHYFDSHRLRTFVGIGFGIYEIANSTSGFEPGFYPRMGFDVGHFNMTIDYNWNLNSIYTSYDYLAVRFGFYLGGGKKKTSLVQ